MNHSRDFGRIAAVLLSLACGAALAAARGEQEITLYFGQGVDSNLPDLPGKAFGGKLHFDKTWMTGLGVAYPDVPIEWFRTALGWIGLEHSTTSKEIVVTKHTGLQQHVEWGALYVLRTPYASLGPVRMRVGAGAGLSYAWGTPTYEDGPEDDPQRRYKLQNFDAYELETKVARHFSVVGRIHHRSGAYGLIAPRNVGSNFLTVSLRYEY